MASSRDVSVYVPCYNGSAFLPQVLRAIWGQEHPVMEVILVDDGSTDDSAACAERTAEAERQPLTIIRHAENRGLASARNTALKACRTEYLAGLDSDVRAEPSWLGRLMEAFARDPGLAGVGGRLIEMHARELGDRWRARHLAQSYGSRPLENPRFLFGANHVYRNRCLLDVGGYDDRQRRAGDDLAMGEKLARAGARLLYVPDAQCWHLRRDTLCSALATYWRWKYYGNWSDDRSLRRVLWAAGGDITVATARILGTDRRAKDLPCVAGDLLYPAVSLRLHLRAYLSSLTLMRRHRPKP